MSRLTLDETGVKPKNMKIKRNDSLHLPNSYLTRISEHANAEDLYKPSHAEMRISEAFIVAWTSGYAYFVNGTYFSLPLGKSRKNTEAGRIRTLHSAYL